MLKGKTFLHKWTEDAEGREGRKSIYNVYRIPPQLEKMLGGAGSRVGTGPGRERMPGTQ